MADAYEVREDSTGRQQLVEVATRAVVFEDGEPEDAGLLYDHAALVKELNRVAAERDRLRRGLGKRHDAPFRVLTPAEIEQLQESAARGEYLYWWDLGSALETILTLKRRARELLAIHDGLIACEPQSAAFASLVDPLLEAFNALRSLCADGEEITRADAAGATSLVAWDWLTPAELYRIVEQAQLQKVAGAWEHRQGPRELWRRYAPGNHVAASAVRLEAHEGQDPWHWSAARNEGDAATRELAQAAADAALRSAGWRLVEDSNGNG